MHKIALFAYPHRADAVALTHYAANRLLDEGVSVLVEDNLAEVTPPELLSRCTTCAAAELEKYADVVITFGGDGTLLAAAHLLIGTDIPIMGVNVGKLGFLAEFPTSLLDDGLMALLKGDYRIVDRSTLEITVGTTVVYALNEALLERAAGAKMITVRAHVDQHHVADFRSDGVLVATPTGSTAYSLAAGGPIIAPSAEVLCLTAVSPHALTVRSLVVGHDSEIRLSLLNDDTNAQVVADGRFICVVARGEQVRIRKGEHAIKLVKRADNTYFDLLREKLLWSADAIQR